MNLLRSLGVAGWAVRGVFPLMRRGSLWIPFLLIAAVQGLGLLSLMAEGHGGSNPLARWALRSVGGEAATHFPYMVAVIPVVFARLNLALSVLLFTWATAVAVLLFAAAWRGDSSKGRWGAALRRYPGILAIGAATALLSLLVFWLGQIVPAETLNTNRNLRWGMRLLLLVLFVVAQGLFIYALPWFVLRGRSWLRALGDSAGTAIRLAIPTLVVVGIPVVLLFPLDYLAGRADLFLTKLRPDLVGTVLLVKIILELVLGFLLVGAVTRLFLWRTEEEK